MAWNVYLLLSTTGHTYVGATVDLDHRLRQHNGEICGGAKATAKCPGGWQRLCHVEGFANEGAALQFEWAWKYWTRKQGEGSPLDRRQLALEALMSQERATSKALPFSSFPHPLEITYED